jgi:hypothetical protein
MGRPGGVSAAEAEEEAELFLIMMVAERWAGSLSGHGCFPGLGWWNRRARVRNNLRLIFVRDEELTGRGSYYGLQRCNQRCSIANFPPAPLN